MKYRYTEDIGIKIGNDEQRNYEYTEDIKIKLCTSNNEQTKSENLNYQPRNK